MHFHALCLLFFLSSVCAYHVNEPSAKKGWSNSGSQILSWTRVVTDPDTFTVLLTNQNPSIMPQGNQVLAAQVDGGLETIILQPPSGGWPTGNSFRVNLVKSTEELDTILAQSSEFNIGADTELTTSPSTQLSTTNFNPTIRSTSLTPVTTRVGNSFVPPATSATTASTPPIPSAGAQAGGSIKNFEHHSVFIPLLAVLCFVALA